MISLGYPLGDLSIYQTRIVAWTVGVTQKLLGKFGGGVAEAQGYLDAQILALRKFQNMLNIGVLQGEHADEHPLAHAGIIT